MFGFLWLRIVELRKIRFTNLTDRFAGRHTFFIVFFALTGFGLACFGKLTEAYAALVTALQASVLLHSWKDDKKDCDGNSNGT